MTDTYDVTTAKATPFSSEDVYTLADVTYRQLDHWCTNDVYGSHVVRLGSGRRREFTWDDVVVTYVLGVYYHDVSTLEGYTMGTYTAMYKKIAEQVRQRGMRYTFTVRLGKYTTFTIEIDYTDLLARLRALRGTTPYTEVTPK